MDVDIEIRAKFDGRAEAARLINDWPAPLSARHVTHASQCRMPGGTVEVQLWVRAINVNWKPTGDGRIRLRLVDAVGTEVKDAVAGDVNVTVHGARRRGEPPQRLREAARVALRAPRSRSAEAYVAKQLKVRACSARVYLSQCVRDGLLRRVRPGVFVRP